MTKKYILAIDQGTTGSRAFIFDSTGKVVSSAYKEFKQYYPQPGWVEHDAEEIWESVCDVIKHAIRKVGATQRVARTEVQKNIVSIGITNQRETTVLWNKKTSKPLHRAIVWQCRRSADICRSLKKHESTFRARTGLVLDPYFSGTKIKWLLDNVKGLKKKAKSGQVCFGTIDSWLIYKLTNGASHVTDMTNASRTLIFNIKTKKWDDKLLKILRIPKNILPKVQNSGSVFGQTAVRAGSPRPNMKGAKTAPLPSGIPITAVLGDQQAALYGQGCTEPGSVKNTYGTGCFIVLNTGKKYIASKKGLLTTLASDAQGKPVYAMEGAVFIAGAVIQWLRDELKLIRSASETEERIKNVKDTNGIYMVPAFTGLGAPYWDSEARGIITGLTRGVNADHIIRAALESICYQTKEVFDIMKSESRRSIKELKVDGGACANDFLMQFQADLLDCRITRPKNVDSTACGAAYLAGIVSGVWSTQQLKRLKTQDRTFKPRMTKNKRKEIYQGWLKAIKRARSL